MDQPSTLKKDEIIAEFGKEIRGKLSLPVGSLERDLSDLFLELIEVFKTAELKGDDAAEIFESLDSLIDKHPPSMWIDGVPVPPDGGAIHRAKAALAFRAERFFRDHYRKQIENLDLPGKMEFISERLEAFRRIRLGFGQRYVMPALEYLNGELESEYRRVKKAKKRRASLNTNENIPPGQKKSAGENDRLTPSSRKKTVNSKIHRHKDLTIDRAIFLIDALGGSRLKSADKNKLAQVVAFLTGDSPESVRQRYSALNPDATNYKGNTDSGMKILEEDLRILSHYLDLIGLGVESEKLSDSLGIPFTK